MINTMLVTFLAVLSCLFAATAGQCSNSQFTYSSVDQRCYYVSRTSTTWASARTVCQNMGGKLAVIHDATTNLAVDQAALAVDPNLIFWIGLQVTGGLFQWVDGSMMDYNSWNTGFPQLIKGYDCVAMRLGSRGYWENILCANSYPYICQANAAFIPTSTTTASPNTCPNNPYYGPSGVITSPNYPGNYPNNARCVYNIILTAGNRVYLRINDIVTETCCDFLYIYDGPNINSPLIQRCAGSTCSGASYYSSSNTMTLQFTSDQSNTFRGFNASYSTAPGTTTTMPVTPTGGVSCNTYSATGSGEFFSYNYPGQYINNLRCFYVLNAYNGNVPSIYFKQFRTENGFDYVDFYDSSAVTFGPGGSITINGNSYLRLTGSTPNGQTYRGRTQTTVLYFYTDGSNTDIGFDGQWTSVSLGTTTTSPMG